MKKLLSFKPVWAIAAAGGILALALLSLRNTPQLNTPSTTPIQGNFVTQKVDKGDVVRTIQASGTLNAVTQISVGAQTSGLVKRVLVDFNDPVRKGQLLAEIDTQVLQDQLLQVKAQAHSAAIKLEFSRRHEERQHRLFNQGFIAKADLDEAVQGRLLAQASVEQQQAAVQQSETNLRNARIVSPIDGLVLSRSVNEGQTVAANFQTPELFKLARDLRSMQIEVNISEADVGMVRPGVPVQFTVDAFADRTFNGTLIQVRNNYTVVQNVVTYTAIVHADNPDDVLRPGMTAYIAIEVERASQALRVPNSALRFRMAAAPGSAATDTGPKPSAGVASVYRLRGGTPELITFTPGTSNALHTVVKGDALSTGDVLVVGDRSGAAVGGPPGFKLF